MAKKILFNVSFAMTVGVSTEVESGIEILRETLRKEVSKVGLEAVLARGSNGHSVVNKMLDPAVSTEEVLVEMVKSGARNQLEGLREDRKDGNFQRIGDISLSQVNKFAKVKASCQDCVRTECSRPSKRNSNAGCEEKELGIRAPHFEQRFEKTV